MQNITDTQITATLDELEADYTRTPEGAYRVDSLLVYWDDQVPPDERGWAWRHGDESGPLDSLSELRDLVRRAMPVVD